MVDRRNFIAGGAALGFGVATAKVLAEPAAAPSALKAIITLGGKQYTFDASSGQDMGNYVGEFVQQRCIRVERPDTPLTIYFRPDVTNDRVEVVVELGKMWAPGGAAANIMEPYKAVIQRGDRVLATVDVPYHWWWARWRWQSALRPVVRKPSALIARNLLPPYGDSMLYGLPPWNHEARYDAPMATAGVDTDMGSTGNRPDIGPVTECQADYIIRGGDTAFRTMIAQAEACGSMPIHWRDEKTGAFIDFQRYPTATINTRVGSPVIAAPPAPKIGGEPDRRYFRVETAHTPGLAYVPYMLTDDPYYLEELQALGSLGIGAEAFHRQRRKLPGLADPGQTRAFAWSMRSLFQLGVVSPEKPPSWLLPKSYWRRCIADNRAFVQLYMNSPAHVHRYFRVFPASAFIATWQNSMIAFIFGWANMMGYSEWRAPYEWFMPGLLAQCDGRSGWPRGYPTPYLWHVLKILKQKEDAAGLWEDASIDAQTCKDWAEAWQQYKTDYNVSDAGWDGHSIFQHQSGPDYFLFLQSALRIATRLNISGAKACSDYIESQIPGIVAEYRANGQARWSVEQA
jgi:hypothetical protein